MASNNLPVGTADGNGILVATILSAYDLPCQDQPIGVSVRCGDVTVQSGPPISRQRGKNSFKFVNGDNTNNHVISIRDMPLPELYKSTAILTVEYENKVNNLVAKVPLNTLIIRETTWLILNLAPSSSDQLSPSSSVAASQSSNMMNSRTTETSTTNNQPTLRVKLTLDGNYRPEVAFIIKSSEIWFHFVEQLEIVTSKVITTSLAVVPSYNTNLGIPTPIFVGALCVGLLPFLPIVAIFSFILLALSPIFGTLYFSTIKGRRQLAIMFAPATTMFMSSRPGQRLIYETGPRPTPVSVARVIIPKGLWGKLIVSLIIDAIGNSSYLLPGLGEGTDLVWAPIQTFLIMAMYDDVSPNLKYLSFAEEILPLTDIIPSASIGWISEYGPELIRLLPSSSSNESQSSSRAS